ncbi:MAG TPA: hypothetical protein VFO83_06190 [Aggregicoccus sp.]|nr:hypothetical protein [Aggregicoccus sp.]
MRRFPLRTLLLMLAALFMFGRLWCVTHRSEAPAPQGPPSSPGIEMRLPPPRSVDAGQASASACRAADQALAAALKAPGEGALVASAQEVVRTCPTLPPRACELGPALDAGEPLGQKGPLRELLAGLCERCPAQGHPCTGLFLRGLQNLEEEDLAATRWNLEHAGAASTLACEALARDLVVPAASASERPSPAARRAFEALVPVCLRHDALPSALLHAAVVNRRLAPGEKPAKEDLFERALAVAARGEYARVQPDEVLGSKVGTHTFDARERSGIDLGNGEFGRWEADGALRAQFEEPLAWLGGLRVKARGPGTLRAIVRLEGVGLEDPERKRSFVNPTVCQFKGTGAWEDCKLPLPLQDVEAISVFPGREKISLYEVEILGTRASP